MLFLAVILKKRIYMAIGHCSQDHNKGLEPFDHKRKV